MTEYVKEIMYLFMCGECGCSDDAETNYLTEAIRQMRNSGMYVLGANESNGNLGRVGDTFYEECYE